MTTDFCSRIITDEKNGAQMFRTKIPYFWRPMIQFFEGSYYHNILTHQLIPFASRLLISERQCAGIYHTSKLLISIVRRLPVGRKMRLPEFFKIDSLYFELHLEVQFVTNQNLWSIVKRKHSTEEKTQKLLQD